MRNRRRLTGEQKRLCVLAVVFMLLMMGVLYRTFSYQVIGRAPWLEELVAQGQSYKIIPAERGIIYDRHMNALSLDMPATALAVDPAMPGDRDALACTLSAVLGGVPADFTSLFDREADSRYIRLRNVLTISQRNRLADSGFEALIFEESLQRVRPAGDLALQLLGVTQKERAGAWGIEQQLNRKLTGVDGWAVEQKDALNRSHESIDLPVQKPRKGNNVILSIDHSLQTIVEEEMRASVKLYNARFGTAVLIDPFSGEILAMTSAVGRGGRNGDDAFNEKMKNRTVQWAFEPGSVFKIVTLAAALEEGLFTPKSLIFCENGSYRLGNEVIHDHEESFAWLTLNQVMTHSSNIGVAKVAQKIGRKRLYKYIQNFGFGNKTGIGLPGEAAGLLRAVYEWTPFSIASISFGQELSATPLQVVFMVAAVANGGELLQPQLVKRITDAEGEILDVSSPRVIRRVISERTAAEITAVLRNVVEDGSGAEAAVQGVTVAGKTGTAEKSVSGHRGYLPGANVCSFVGFWPAESPKYAMLVVFDEPVSERWGSKTAAPAFGRIVERIAGLPGLTVPPRQITERVPEPEAAAVFAALPAAADNASPQEPELPRQEDSRNHIPDMRGMSVRQAMMKLADLNVTAVITGVGVVRRHEPAAGKKIEPGLVCRLIGDPLSGEI